MGFELHLPVMVEEVLRDLFGRPDGIYLDATTGTAGHSRAILSRLAPPGRLVCLEQNPATLEIARAELSAWGDQVHFHRGSFHQLDRVLEAEGLTGFDGILADLGLNSWTLARPESGLSYLHEAPLSMRLDPDLPMTAESWLRHVDEPTLADVFHEFGDLRRARLYARRIVESRRRRPLRTTADLVEALSDRRPLPEAELSRCFQSIRIFINEEMDRLDTFLRSSPDWVLPGGRLVIISYASQEDRRVKEALAQGRGPGEQFEPLHKKPLAASVEEVRANRRARSAHLRGFTRRAA